MFCFFLAILGKIRQIQRMKMLKEKSINVLKLPVGGHMCVDSLYKAVRCRTLASKAGILISVIKYHDRNFKIKRFA